MLIQAMSHEPVIDPVSWTRLERELVPKRLARRWNGLEIYILDGSFTPHVMDEIGRIREVEFRREGNGTGKAKDIDAFDRGPVPYLQIVSWDPDAKEIVAMYRYQTGARALDHLGPEALATHELFQFSDPFIRDYLPYTIELGRSVVNRDAKKKRFGLWSIWSGLGVVIAELSEMQFFFGKLTITSSYPPEVRQVLFDFCHCVLPGRPHLVCPKAELAVPRHTPTLGEFHRDDGFQLNCKKLQDQLKRWGLPIPPLMHAYLGLTEKIETFGTVVNPQFGNAFETALLLPIREINVKRRQQFIDNYIKTNPGLLV